MNYYDLLLLSGGEAVVYKDFAGTAALTSTVSDATLKRLLNFSGTSPLVSSLADISLKRLHNISGQADLSSNVPDAILKRLLDLAGVAALESTTADITLKRLLNFAGQAPLDSQVLDISLQRLLNLSGTASLVSSVPDIALSLVKNFSGTAALVSNVPNAVLKRLLATSGTAVLISQVPDAVLKRLLSFSGQANLTSQIPDLSLKRLLNISGTATLVSEVSDLSLNRLLNFTGAAALTSLLSDINLSVVRDFLGTAAMQSQVSDIVLQRLLNLAGTAQMVSSLSDIELRRLLSFSGVADLVSRVRDIFLAFYGELYTLPAEQVTLCLDQPILNILLGENSLLLESPISERLLLKIKKDHSIICIDANSICNSYHNTGLGLYYRGQSFTGNGKTLGAASLIFNRAGLPTPFDEEPPAPPTPRQDYSKVYIFAHSGIYGTSSIPTGSPLAVSDPFYMPDIPEWIDYEVIFTFSGSNRIELVNGAKYVLVFSWYAPLHYWIFAYCWLKYNNVSVHDGNMCFYSNGIWTPNSSYDLAFRVIHNQYHYTPIVMEHHKTVIVDLED